MNAHEHAAEGSAPDVHELDHHLSDYKRIITILSVATLIEFGISHVMSGGSLPLAAGILILVAIAFFKAVLVAKFFMHLRYDAKVLAVIAAIPLLLASFINIICCFDAIKGPSI